MTELKAELEALKAGMWKKQYFVMLRTVADASRMPDALLEHYRWIIELEKANKVFASGPLSDRSDKPGVGMTVFRADSWEEAEALAAGDPFVQSGAVRFEVQRWQINEGRINVALDFSDQTFSAS